MAQPRVIFVGGGFAGLAAAKALRGSPAEILLIAYPGSAVRGSS